MPLHHQLWTASCRFWTATRPRPRLVATGNGPALVGELVERFVVSTPVDLADLRAALHHGDAIGVTRIAHRLKGAAGTVGSSGMVSLCEQLELRARAGAIPPAGDLFTLLEQELDRVIRALEAVVPGLGNQDPDGDDKPSPGWWCRTQWLEKDLCK
jgi:HPt (histidine-containing phosphotransfer) domain-containing protein